MGDAEERKKAKEAYMKALEAQRQKPVESIATVSGGQSGPTQGDLTAAQKREQQLEERRKKFFDRSGAVVDDNLGTANNNSIYNAAPSNIGAAKPAAQSVADTNFRPSDWKSKGYPSEYAYMKAAGQLDIPSKPTVVAPVAAVAGNPYDFGGKDQSHQSQHSGDNYRQNSSVSGLGLNFGAAPDKESKRQKQAGYAQALDQQSGFQAPSQPPSHQPQFGNLFLTHNSNKPVVGGGGLNIGAVDDKELKRQKQAEYARALDQQAQPTQADNNYHTKAHNSNHHENHGVGSSSSAYIGGGGGGLNIGGAVDDKELKRQKQAEYARALDQQSYAQPPVDSHHHQSRAAAQHNSNMAVQGGGGGLNIGGAVDDKELKRQKQAEYARALDQQSYAQPPVDSHHQSRAAAQHNSNMAVQGGGGGLNIGGAVDDKELKRQKQAEYARALDRQKQGDAWGGGGGGNRAQGQQNGGLGLAGFGGPGPQEAAFMKKQQQQEYTNQLNQAQYEQPGKLNKFGEYEAAGGRGQAHQQQPMDGAGGVAGLGGLQGKDAAHAKRQQQREYTDQLNMQAQYQQPAKLNKFGEYEQPGRHQAQQAPAPSGVGRQTDVNNIGMGGDGRNDKRAKQAEYNMALQQQQYLQSLQQPVKDKHAEQRAAASSAVTGFKAGGGLEEGWVIGPMGLPVRKTLEVGNRGVQRAYANHIQETHSPAKVNANAGINSMAGGYGGQGPGQGAGQMQGQGNHFDMDSFQQAAYMLNSPPRYNDGFGGGGGVRGGAGGFHGGEPAGALGGEIGGDPDDRATKMKLQQAEQARVLQMQIQQKKQQKDAEKKKQDEDDRKEIEKMEMQRIAIQQEHERELQEKKRKIDEDNKRELERQMEQKRRDKQVEDEKEQERKRKEEARVNAEAEDLRRQQEQEMQREAAEARRQEQQRLHAQQLEQKQSQLQVDALHRQHAPPSHHQNRPLPEDLFESALPARDPSRGGGAGRDNGGAGRRDKSHLFGNADPDDGELNRNAMGRNAGSRGGARDRNHLFGKAESDEDFSTPMSPGKRHVNQVLAQRIQHELYDDRAEERQEYHEPLHRDVLPTHFRQQEAQEAAKSGVPPPILNLSNLKRNISEKAVLSGRRSARGAGGAGVAAAAATASVSTPVVSNNSRVPSRQGVKPMSSPHDPYHPERELQETEAEDSFSPLPMHRPPSRSPQKPRANLHNANNRRSDENQYVPASQMHAHQLNAARLDKTLEFESKFLLPDGTFMQSQSKPSTPALTSRWSKLGRVDARHHSDNRCNSRESSAAMSDVLSPGKRDITSPASSPLRDFINDFQGTLQLLQQPNESLAQRMSQQRPSTSGSVNSDFDIEKFNRRNNRKWQVLQGINGDKDSPVDDLLFRGVSDVHSRPTTASSIGSTYRPHLFDPYSQEKGGYSYGVRAEPSSVYHPVRGGGIAVRSSSDHALPVGAAAARPNSAELARKLTRLNNHDASANVESSNGYGGHGKRPMSGKKNDNKLVDGFSMGQRAEMNLHKTSSRQGRYASVAGSVEDPDFDNYSDYGL